MNFCLIPLTFDVCDTNTYGWVTHGEGSQNDMKLLPIELHNLGIMPLKYQLKIAIFDCPYLAVTLLCKGDTHAYVSLLTRLCIGGFGNSKSTTRHLHLCTMMRGTCVQGLVRKCGAGQEINSVLYPTHIHS